MDIPEVTKEEIRAVVVLVSSRTRSHVRLVSRVWPGLQIGSDIRVRGCRVGGEGWMAVRGRLGKFQVHVSQQYVRFPGLICP